MGFGVLRTIDKLSCPESQPLYNEAGATCLRLPNPKPITAPAGLVSDYSGGFWSSAGSPGEHGAVGRSWPGTGDGDYSAGIAGYPGAIWHTRPPAHIIRVTPEAGDSNMTTRTASVVVIVGGFRAGRFAEGCLLTGGHPYEGRAHQ